jgi:hypothetical protein
VSCYIRIKLHPHSSAEDAKQGKQQPTIADDPHSSDTFVVVVAVALFVAGLVGLVLGVVDELGRVAEAMAQNASEPLQRSVGFDHKENVMTDDPGQAQWNVADWHGKMLIDRDGEKIGKLQDVYVDVETDVPQFATVKEGIIGRHLTFVPLGGIRVGPDDLQVSVTKDQVRSAPDIEMHGEELSQAEESTLYHHFELNYTPIATESGRRLARR